MEPTLDTLAKKAETALIAFLRAELKLGFTYANTARLENGFDSAGERRAIKLATDALATIERFRDRVSEPAIREEIGKGAADLVKLLSSFSLTLATITKSAKPSARRSRK